MILLLSIPINSLSVIVLSVILFYSKKYGETESLQNKIYMILAASTIIMLILDTVGRADGYPGSLMPVLNHIGNFLLFLFNPLTPTLYILFAYCFISKKEKIDKKIKALVISVNAVNTSLVILTQWFGWYYYIDAGNIYHRGPLYFISVIFPFFLMTTAFILIFRNRNSMENKYYYSLLIFIFPPLICALLQCLIYGISIIYNGIAVSVFNG